MLNSKVIDILKTFSAAEIKRFSEFLKSPFHNKNKKVILLFDLLSHHHPCYDDSNLTKEKLFGDIFPNTNKFNDASIRNLLSDLMILSENFLSYIRFEKDTFDFNEKCLREIIDRKLENIFEKKIKIVESSLQSGEFTGEDLFYKKYIFEELKSFNSQFADNLKLYKDNSILDASEYLSFFFLIRAFKMINFFKFQMQYNITHEENLAELLINDSDIEGLLENKINSSDGKYLILFVYYKMYKAQKYPGNDSYYFDFKNTLIKNDGLFSLLEKYGLYVCLTNSCVQKIDLGNELFFKECFEIYKIMFQKNLFNAYSGYFAMTTFSAIINTGLAAGEFEWIDKFILEYKNKLNPLHRDDAVNYGLAQLNFKKGNFSKALEFISKTNTEFSNFKFHLKILQLKIYFELGDFESLYYTADSFQHFIGKNKIVGNTYKEEFSKFTRILDLLVKYKLEKSDKLYYKIKMLLDNKSIASRKWLLEIFDQNLKN